MMVCFYLYIECLMDVVTFVLEHLAIGTWHFVLYFGRYLLVSVWLWYCHKLIGWRGWFAIIICCGLNQAVPWGNEVFGYNECLEIQWTFHCMLHANWFYWKRQLLLKKRAADEASQQCNTAGSGEVVHSPKIYRRFETFL